LKQAAVVDIRRQPLVGAEGGERRVGRGIWASLASIERAQGGDSFTSPQLTAWRPLGGGSSRSTASVAGGARISGDRRHSITL